MLICSGKSIYGLLFHYTSCFSLFIFVSFYALSLVKYFQNNERNKIHKFDVFILTFSFSQVLLMFFYFIKPYFLLSLFITLLKFTQNTIICCLLLVILKWKFDSIYVTLMNYTLILILLVDFLCFFGAEYEYALLSLEPCKAKTEILLNLTGYFFDLVIMIMNVYINYHPKQEDSLNLIVKEDQYYLNHVFASFVTRMKKLNITYVIILGFFLLSFSIEIILFLAGDDNENNASNINENDCEYYGIFKDLFGKEQMMICFICFILRDILPHLYIYLGLLIFKIPD